MTCFAKLTAATISTACATAAWSADYKVQRTLELSAPAKETWHMIDDFCDIDDWHPAVSDCALKVMDGSLVRVLTTRAGDTVIQQILAREAGLSYTYKTVSTSLPIDNYTATLSIEPFDKPLIAWSANFSSEDPAMEQVVVEEIEAGLAAIEAILTSR